MPPEFAVVLRGDTFPNSTVVRCFQETLGPRGYLVHENSASIKEMADELRAARGSPEYPSVVLYCIDRQEPFHIDLEL